MSKLCFHTWCVSLCSVVVCLLFSVLIPGIRGSISERVSHEEACVMHTTRSDCPAQKPHFIHHCFVKSMRLSLRAVALSFSRLCGVLRPLPHCHAAAAILAWRAGMLFISGIIMEASHYSPLRMRDYDFRMLINKGKFRLPS